MSMEFSVRGVFCLLFTITLLIAYISHVDAQGGDLSIKRSDFPKDFAFGVATSAMQIEGSPKADGRGATIWDTYVQRSGKIKGGNVSLNAIDSYTRYKDDIKIIKDLGISYYRLSISWTRILPKGSLKGGVNQKGIDYYNNVINELLLNGITPFVTILHFDTPQVLEDEYGSFLNRSIVDDFKDYCDLVFKTFGDRVKNWMTINEPFVMALGYDLGIMAPGRCSLPPPLGPCPAGNSATEPYIVGHNTILAHAAGAKLYKEKYQAIQGGQIGIVLVGEYAEPNNPQSPEDKLASERYMDFLFGWYVEPLVYGDYPKSMKTYAKERLPKFTKEEKKLVKGSFDFIGINYYTSRYTKPADHPSVPMHYLRDSLVNSSAVRDGIPIGPKNEASGYIYSYPQGLQKLLEYIKQKYQNPTIYITENGVPEPNVPGKNIVESLDDQHRITFITQHLYYTNQAIKNGANVKGYFYWALFDDFEWADGYFPRFGLYFVDYENNYKRTPKKSAQWFQTFLLQDKASPSLYRELSESPSLSPAMSPAMSPASANSSGAATLNGFFSGLSVAAAIFFSVFVTL